MWLVLSWSSWSSVSHNTCYLPKHPLHSCARRRRRDQLLSFCGKSVSSCPPAPPRPSTHRQLPARLHAVSNSCGPFCHLKPTSLANLFASSETCIRSPMSFGTCASSPHVHAVGSRTVPSFQMMYSIPSDSSSAVLSHPRSMTVTFLSSATSPCQC